MKRRVTAVVVTLLCLAATLLACLPQSAMSEDEMACCKKMSGHCDELGGMGGGHHKCCETTVNRAGVTPAIAPSSTNHDLHLQATITGLLIAAVAVRHLSDEIVFREIVPSLSPPAAPIILKN